MCALYSNFVLVGSFLRILVLHHVAFASYSIPSHQTNDIPTPPHAPPGPTQTPLRARQQLHDFFVETLGHRALAFLELEYCEGGDLGDLIVGGRAGRPAAGGEAAAAPTASAAKVRGDGDVPSVPQRDGPGAGHTGSGEGGGWRSGGGWERTGDGVAGARAGDMAGLPAAQIGRVALGLCEGLQRLHEVG